MWRGGRAAVPWVLLLALLANRTDADYALYFTGSGYVSIPDNTAFPSGSSDYTMEAWIKPTQLGARGIIGWGNFGNTNDANALRLQNGVNILHYWWYNDLEATLTTDLANGAWHHVAATANATTRAIWLNGTMIASDDAPQSSTHAVPSNVQNIYIGMTYATFNFFIGWMDEVRVWNTARTGAQLRAGMYSQLPSTTTGLVGQWHFDEG
jgi:hypothetical protein